MISLGLNIFDPAIKSPAWTPNRVKAAVIGWWDAQDAPSVTQSSGAVSSWASKSGNYALSQPAAAARPTWTQTAFPGGLPGVSFDGAAVDGDMLSSATGPFDNDAWLFMAVSKGVQTDDASVATRTMIRTAIGGVIARILGFRPTTDAGLGYLRIAGSGTGSATGEQQGFFSGPHVVWANLAAANLQTRFDGNAGGTVGAVGTDPISVFEIGGSSAGPAAERFAGVFGEIMIVDKGLLPSGGSASERQLFEGYLAWKWGLQASLPSNHPYRNTRPT